MDETIISKRNSLLIEKGNIQVRGEASLVKVLIYFKFKTRKVFFQYNQWIRFRNVSSFPQRSDQVIWQYVASMYESKRYKEY